MISLLALRWTDKLPRVYPASPPVADGEASSVIVYKIKCLWMEEESLCLW